MKRHAGQVPGSVAFKGIKEKVTVLKLFYQDCHPQPVAIVSPVPARQCTWPRLAD